MKLVRVTKALARIGSIAAMLLSGSIAIAAPTAPAAPSSLSASAGSASVIQLRWLDNSSNEQGFIVQRSLNGSSGFVQIANLGAGSVSFSNTGLSPATTYYYRVAAYAKVRGALVYSNYSNVASAMTLSGTSPTTTTTTTMPAPPSTTMPPPTTTTTTIPSTSSVYPPDGLYRAVSIPQLAKPALYSPVTDPTFGTKIQRITTNIPVTYAKTQTWNSNQTLIGVGSDNRTILDGKTYQPLRTLPWVASEVKWSNVDPNKMYGINGNSFVSINATTGAATLLRTFSGYSNIYMGPWEGNISKDDRYVVFITSLGTDADIIVYDIINNVIVAQKSLVSMGYTGSLQPIDWASISQSGNYVVILAGGWQTSQNTVKSYDRNLNPIATVFSVGQHGDLGYDSFGNEVFVQVGVSGGPAWMGRLDNGQKTAILDTGLGNAGHLSCRNILRPGWCYVTLSQTKEILAVKLDGSRIVERFVHPRNSGDGAMGIPSPDGTRVMFQSDWYGTSTVDAYVVGMP